MNHEPRTTNDRDPVRGQQVRRTGGIRHTVRELTSNQGTRLASRTSAVTAAVSAVAGIVPLLVIGWVLVWLGIPPLFAARALFFLGTAGAVALVVVQMRRASDGR
ncbi:exosortase/archaeosortase family protein [Thermomonospora umbrina]|uniref:Uncharacterized protein n=1 Tax=Thermomonospora umbrina TaxID=111806 RepID=A0A3D9SWL1_9ACTN|nr:exosortase/archaeosortase family protein [Thermomonospora umbrina]REF00343.1 hypothetical protein DFJ69_5875 [Thermomonospora umbrina]